MSRASTANRGEGSQERLPLGPARLFVLRIRPERRRKGTQTATLYHKASPILPSESDHEPQLSADSVCWAVPALRPQSQVAEVRQRRFPSKSRQPRAPTCRYRMAAVDPFWYRT